jgi:glyoxylase-like metal-dependent hydrolase (beta-lactamase superfamily II)
VTLAPIADDLWELGHRIRQPGGVWMPVRMTVVRLPGRQLVLHSPVPIDDDTAAALAGLGDVAHVIAPNRMHRRWAPDAARRYPDARVWDPSTLGDPLHDVLDQVRIDGAPRMDETVFYDRRSRTLICADLVFHVTRPANLRTRLVLAMMGAGGGRLAASRAWRFLVKDRAPAAASLARVLAWDIDRIVMGHGEIVERDGRAALEAAHLDRLVGRQRLLGR